MTTPKHLYIIEWDMENKDFSKPEYNKSDLFEIYQHLDDAKQRYIQTAEFVLETQEIQWRSVYDTDFQYGVSIPYNKTMCTHIPKGYITKHEISANFSFPDICYVFKYSNNRYNNYYEFTNGECFFFDSYDKIIDFCHTNHEKCSGTLKWERKNEKWIEGTCTRNCSIVDGSYNIIKRLLNKSYVNQNTLKKLVRWKLKQWGYDNNNANRSGLPSDLLNFMDE